MCKVLFLYGTNHYRENERLCYQRQVNLNILFMMILGALFKRDVISTPRM